MFESIFAWTWPSVAMQTTGVVSSISAIGPCFISPAAYASLGMYATSFNFNASSTQIGYPAWRPGKKKYAASWYRSAIASIGWLPPRKARRDLVVIEDAAHA